MAWRTRLLAVVGGALVALVVAAIILSRPPRWWRPVEAGDASAAARGEALENAFVGETHRVRESSQTWSVKLRDSDVNAWLATRLPKWLDHAGVEAPPRSMVRFVNGAIDCAVECPGLRSAGVIRVVPTIAEGRLRLEESRTRLGSLPVPVSARWFVVGLTEALDDASAPREVALLARALSGEAIEPRFRLGDGRILVLKDLWLEEGELRLEFETVLDRRNGR